jgi:glyoxalase family protein
MNLLGLHHVSILTGKAERNYQFYTNILGMRLIKKGVNQDNTSSYHLFYGDANGTPGTEITFFDIPGLGHTYPGISSISRVSLRVKSTTSLRFWRDRFAQARVVHGEIIRMANRDTLIFEDFEGTKLMLVADNGEKGIAPGIPWSKPDIPIEHAIIGLGPVTLTVGALEPTAKVLTEILGFQQIGSFLLSEKGMPKTEIFSTGEGGAGAEVYVEIRPGFPKERLGRGGVHHVAFRVPNEDELSYWVQRINKFGYVNSGEVDRYYFRALYFREPNGILFELSTDTPGFDVDEDIESLGEKLSLPPFLETKREEIEASLRPLELKKN